MEYDLVVTSPVAGFETGQRITDPAIVDALLADREQAVHVVRVARAPVADASAVDPAADPAPAAKTEKAPAKAS